MSEPVAGWPHSFDVGTACVFCGTKTRPVVRRGEKERGVCEACAVEAHWAWREEPRGKVSAVISEKPARLEVLLLRLASAPLAPGELPPNPVSPYSYELAVAVSGSDVALPSADLDPEESDFAAAERALRPLGLVTFGSCVELLCDAHSLRGDIVRVVLATAWARSSRAETSVPGGKSDEVRRPGSQRVTDSALVSPRVTDPAPGSQRVTDPTPGSQTLGWRDWPPWEAVPGTGGLYLPLREVLALRSLLYQSQEPRPPALSVEVRRVCAEYVATKLRIRAGEVGVDDSMLEYQRGAMTDYERGVAERALRWEEAEDEAASELEESKPAGKTREDKLDGVLPDPDEVSAPAGSEAATIEESFGDEDT